MCSVSIAFPEIRDNPVLQTPVWAITFQSFVLELDGCVGMIYLV